MPIGTPCHGDRAQIYGMPAEWRDGKGWIKMGMGNCFDEKVGHLVEPPPSTKPLNALAARINKTAEAKGWWGATPPSVYAHRPDMRAGAVMSVRNVPEMLMLAVSELAEALECYRDDPQKIGTWWYEGAKPEGFPVETADAIIRLLDLLAALGVDIDACVEAKMAYNETRAFRHGGKAC